MISEVIKKMLCNKQYLRKWIRTGLINVKKICPTFFLQKDYCKNILY